jgi:hypothetical protein
VIRSHFYTIVHKHLRRALFDFSIQLGGADRHDVATIVDAFGGIAGMLRGHAQREDASIGAMLREMSPDLESAWLEILQHLRADSALLERAITAAREILTPAQFAHLDQALRAPTG